MHLAFYVFFCTQRLLLHQKNKVVVMVMMMTSWLSFIQLWLALGQTTYAFAMHS